MKRSIGILICASVSIVFMSCETSDEIQGDPNNNHGTDVVSKQSSLLQSTPALAIPDDIDPKCKSEDRKLFKIYDTQEVEFEDYPRGGYCNNDDVEKEACAKGLTILNGKLVTVQEYNDYMEDYLRRYEEMMNSREKARNIPIPCELEYSYRSWVALLTEDEVANLQKKYNHIQISNFVEDKDVPVIPESNISESVSLPPAH